MKSQVAAKKFFGFGFSYYFSYGYFWFGQPRHFMQPALA
jgi:hypothetical protein